MTIAQEPLRNFWHVVALSSEVQDKPFATTLLDQQLVLWRTENGISALDDMCIHRGARLSLGWVEQDQIRCPYHGWGYNAAGSCAQIPALPAGRPIPGKARVKSYQCQERYGLIFVCLGEPQQPLYEVPEFEQSGFKTHIVGPVTWQASAARSLENFMDEAHLPFVHPEMLGNRHNVPEVDSRDVEERDGGFYFECQSEVSDRIDRSKMTVNRLTYHIVLPFMLYHENIYPNGNRVLDLFFSTPVSTKKCVRYMVVGRNFALDQPSERFADFTQKIWEQDRAIIESQRPEELPIDWNMELHLRGPDAPSVAYRKMLRAMGVAKVA
ncbi:MAG: Rieske (2Fe-2S) iron-sulfur domain protein [Noviherbaspirillum sp.]|jgi:phenylpropionate dioxygenase-like ring-hydroxylating dioxygenase large terminal subunit|nr:Rieske (2Fe-2S) iron-sulfur domain protein [Noviherbaspirillum sp.]